MATQPKTTKDKIAEKEPVVIDQIPFSFVRKHSNKITKLLANSNATAPIEGQSRWYSFEFSESMFIYRIVVTSTNYPEYKDFEVEAIREDGSKSYNSNSPKSGRVFLDVNDFCRSVGFRPPQAYLHFDKSIDSVEIYGFSRSEAGAFIQFSRDIDGLKELAIAEIDRRESSHQKIIDQASTASLEVIEARKEVSTLKSQADRQKSTIRGLESERADLTTKSEVLKDTIEKNTQELGNLRGEISTKSEIRETLNKQTASLGIKLAELRANVDLFPSELESFVKQGTRNNKTLFWLALSPILIIAVMFGLLIFGAAELSTKITESQNINIAALIVSRAPYVIISLTIIAACYQIVRYFIFELIQVNRQRLNLTKVSIIAKDVSAAAEAGLDLSDIERYGLRVRLKMELLKDHLKGYISSDLEINLPSQITNALLLDNLVSTSKVPQLNTEHEEANPSDKN
jgi:hypothetical protein